MYTVQQHSTVIFGSCFNLYRNIKEGGFRLPILVLITFSNANDLSRHILISQTVANHGLIERSAERDSSSLPHFPWVWDLWERLGTEAWSTLVSFQQIYVFRHDDKSWRSRWEGCSIENWVEVYFDDTVVIPIVGLDTSAAAGYPAAPSPPPTPPPPPRPTHRTPPSDLQRLCDIVIPLPSKDGRISCLNWAIAMIPLPWGRAARRPTPPPSTPQT